MALSPLTSILHLPPLFCALTYTNPNSYPGPLDGDHYITANHNASMIPQRKNRKYSHQRNPSPNNIPEQAYSMLRMVSFRASRSESRLSKRLDLRKRAQGTNSIQADAAVSQTTPDTKRRDVIP